MNNCHERTTSERIGGGDHEACCWADRNRGSSSLRCHHLGVDGRGDDVTAVEWRSIGEQRRRRLVRHRHVRHGGLLGYGHFGQLGNGNFYSSSVSGIQGSAIPVAVQGLGGTGTLTGAVSLVSADNSFCALLTSGGVDCWGYGADGELGDGTFYAGIQQGSAFPVAVTGVGGSGTLSGVASLASENNSFCALLTSGGVDCWGYGAGGELGDGTFYAGIQQGSAFPVVVTGVGGSGTLTGVASLTGINHSYCALLTSGEVDCWGQGSKGQLGNGTFYTSANFGSAVPVAVKGSADPAP